MSLLCGEVYVIAATGRPQMVKVGTTLNGARDRFRVIQLSNPWPDKLKLVFAVRTVEPRSPHRPGVAAFNLEQRTHAILGTFRTHGEWFKTSALYAVDTVRAAARILNISLTITVDELDDPDRQVLSGAAKNIRISTAQNSMFSSENSVDSQNSYPFPASS